MGDVSRSGRSRRHWSRIASTPSVLVMSGTVALVSPFCVRGRNILHLSFLGLKVLGRSVLGLNRGGHDAAVTHLHPQVPRRAPVVPPPPRPQARADAADAVVPVKRPPARLAFSKHPASLQQTWGD